MWLDLKDGDEEGVLVTVLETIDNVPYVIGGGRLRQGKDQRISFRSTANNIQVVLNGPYTNLLLAQVCTRYARSTAQTYLVEVCDESKDRYRFGFNGQEKVNEIAGVGNHNTAEFWEYDTRLGRRWNLYPKPNEAISSYSTFSGNPISFSDVRGDTVRTNQEGNSYVAGATNEISKNKEGEIINPIGYDAERGVLTYDNNVDISSLNSTQKRFLNNFKALINSPSTTVTLNIVDMDDKIFDKNPVGKQTLTEVEAFGTSVLMKWESQDLLAGKNAKGKTVSPMKLGIKSVYSSKEIVSYAARNPTGIPASQFKLETQITVLHELLGHAFLKMGYSYIWQNNNRGNKLRAKERAAENKFTELLEQAVRVFSSDSDVKKRKVEPHSNE